jgi:hypothetical protein
MKNYICVYTTDTSAEASLFPFKTKKLPKYFEDNLNHTIVLWEDFDLDNPKDSTGEKIPKNAIDFLTKLGIEELSPNEAFKIEEITEFEEV